MAQNVWYTTKKKYTFDALRKLSAKFNFGKVWLLLFLENNDANRDINREFYYTA